MEFCYIHQQNEGEISAFEVHKVDNDNNQAVVIWAMSNLETRDWDPGRVLVESDGEKEYQVGFKNNIIRNVMAKKLVGLVCIIDIFSVK